MKGWLVNGANILLGLVPATYLLFWNVFFLLAGVATLLMPPADSYAELVPWKVALFFAGAIAGVAGYVALIFAVRGEKTPRVLRGLLLGIAANVYAIHLFLDLDPNALKGWFDWYWFGSPIVVALAHVAANLVHARRNASRPATS